ncbi:hypothetical protein [Microbacterium sp.]|uniref:hypothetical protein n=1 Tax=Microbacterium sp. TaxID=51671 RepID=UPI0025E5A19C|nr:hypothetical protein [Microbacterium sp.]
MNSDVVSWDFDVPPEWFKIPLDEDLDTRRWAGEFAEEMAEFLNVDGPIESLADALYDAQSQMSRRHDPWLTALVAARSGPPISIGAVITARLLERDSDDTPESLEVQMRRDAEQMEPGSTSHDLVLWHDRSDAGDYVGMTQRIEHAGDGAESSTLSERAVYVVFPPESANVVRFEFTTAELGYFADIRRETELVVRTLSVTLDRESEPWSDRVGRMGSRDRPGNRVGVGNRPAIVPVALIAFGIMLALMGVASIAHLYVLGMRGLELEGIYPFLRGGEVDTALPGALLLLAAVPLFIGVLLWRASWSVEYGGFWRGGSVRTVAPPLPVWALMLWLLAPLTAWTALVLIPARAREGAYASASEDFWMLAGFYGFVAAAIGGVLLMSLMKRAVFARAASRGLVAPERGRVFWKVVSGGWRVESWCAGLAVGFAGILPLFAADPVAVTVMAVIAAVLAVLGVLFGLGSWRTGEPIGYGESFA